MQLLYSETSPYARKCRIAIFERDLADLVEDVDAFPYDQPAHLLKANPVSRVPALVLDDGRSVTESRLICEWLDTVGDAEPLRPTDPDRSLEVARWEARCDGILDFALRRRMEHAKDEQLRDAKVIEDCGKRILRGLEELEEAHLGFFKNNSYGFSFDTIATIVVLDYVDFRHSDLAWQEKFPKLLSFYKQFENRNSFEGTRV